LSAELSGSKVILDDKDRHLLPVRRMYGTLLTNVTNYLLKFRIRNSGFKMPYGKFKIQDTAKQDSKFKRMGDVLHIYTFEPDI